MAVSIKDMAMAVAILGIISFILGIIAENTKPASGTPTMSKGIVVCKYPSDPTVALGFLSFVSLAASVSVGIYSIFYPYKGKSVPVQALFKSTTFTVYFNITLMVSLLGGALILWGTGSELLHRTRNMRDNMNSTCPTAKTGLFGGAAFMALNASLFWLICLILTHNAREDYVADEQEGEDLKGGYGQVGDAVYNAKEQGSV